MNMVDHSQNTRAMQCIVGRARADTIAMLVHTTSIFVTNMFFFFSHADPRVTLHIIVWVVVVYNDFTDFMMNCMYIASHLQNVFYSAGDACREVNIKKSLSMICNL